MGVRVSLISAVLGLALTPIFSFCQSDLSTLEHLTDGILDNTSWIKLWQQDIHGYSSRTKVVIERIDKLLNAQTNLIAHISSSQTHSISNAIVDSTIIQTNTQWAIYHALTNHFSSLPMAFDLTNLVATIYQQPSAIDNYDFNLMLDVVNYDYEGQLTPEFFEDGGYAYTLSYYRSMMPWVPIFPTSKLKQIADYSAVHPAIRQQFDNSSYFYNSYGFMADLYYQLYGTHDLLATNQAILAIETDTNSKIEDIVESVDDLNETVTTSLSSLIALLQEAYNVEFEGQNLSPSANGGFWDAVYQWKDRVRIDTDGVVSNTFENVPTNSNPQASSLLSLIRDVLDSASPLPIDHINTINNGLADVFEVSYNADDTMELTVEPPQLFGNVMQGSVVLNPTSINTQMTQKVHSFWRWIEYVFCSCVVIVHTKKLLATLVPEVRESAAGLFDDRMT